MTDLQILNMENLELRKWMLQSLNLHGYSIRADATKILAQELEGLSKQERQKWMGKIMDYLQKLNLKSTVIGPEHIELCLQECSKNSEDSEKVWNVINIFEVPRFIYSNEKNKIIQDDSTNLKDMFSDASKKILMYRRRYNLIMQRTLRHDLFRQQKQIGGENPSFSLKTVEWFLCCTKRIENAVIVGLLVQKNESVYAIEDLTGSLELDISEAKFHDGLFPEHCFVLVEGVYEDKIFYVQGIGFPPPESSSKSRPYFGNVNSFGGSSEVDLTQSPSLQKIQESNPGAMIVFISDVWLDKPEVLEKLNILFSGFNLNPPVAFVLIGNFLNGHEGPQNAKNLQTGLKFLGEIIAKARNISKTSHIVLIPGPSDLGAPHIFPRAPLPEVLARELKALVPKAVLATNPCRIQYCNREIVVIREDLIKKMCRNTIHFPKTNDIQMHFVKTILSQGNLVPLSPNVCPVYWNYSHCLDIYPLPDLIVTADQFNAYTVEHMGCAVVNPVFLNPEDTKRLKNAKVKYDDPDVERVRRAHLNDIENIPVFVVAAWLYLLCNPPSWLAINLFRIYTAARILHTVVYAVIVIPQPARAISWGIGYGITAFMLLNSILLAF